MKVLITNPDEPIKRGAVFECDIWIDLDGNTCTIKKNTNYPINEEEPRTFPLDELPQFLREEKILRECRPDLAEIKIEKITLNKLKGATQKWLNPQHQLLNRSNP